MCLPAASIEHLAKRLDNFVRGRSNPSQEPTRTVSLIESLHLSGGRLPISELAAINGIDERTVRREFKTNLGLSPKQYALVTQFNRALRLLREVGLDVISAATEAGYSDQAHMTRVFRKLGGFTPAKIPNFQIPIIPI